MTGKNITLLGSGSMVTPLAEFGLIDEYQLLIDPVVLGKGRPIFKGIGRRLDLKLQKQEHLRAVLFFYTIGRNNGGFV